MPFGGLASDSGRVSARTLGAAARVYAGAAIGRFRFDAGPGARIAWLWLRGEAATPAVEGRALSAAWGGPEVRARVAYGPFRAPLVALELGAGLVTRPVHGLLVQHGRRLLAGRPAGASACLQAGIEW